MKKLYQKVHGKRGQHHKECMQAGVAIADCSLLTLGACAAKEGTPRCRLSCGWLLFAVMEAPVGMQACEQRMG